MEHALFIALLAVCGWAAGRPLLHKPFSEDDGNWFYPAVFKGRGLRLDQFKWRYSMLGVHWLGLIARLVAGRSDARVFYGLKMAWYTLTAVSLYLLAALVWGRPWIGLAGGILFLAATAVPATVFSLTYGEHFFNLPVMGAITLFFMAGDMEPWAAGLAAGFLMGWACHLKPTVLLLVLWMPAMAALSPEPWMTLAGYGAGFVLLNLLPAAYLAVRGGNVLSDLLMLFGAVLIMARKTAQILKLGFVAGALDRLLARHAQSAQIEQYIDRHHSLPWKEQWRQFKTNMAPAAAELRLIVLLATAQAILVFFTADPLALTLLAVTVIYALMQQMQKNYYTPHFNALWAPVGLLAARTLHDLAPVWKQNAAAAAVIAVVIIIEGTRLVLAARTYQRNARSLFGGRSIGLDRLFQKCEEIGAFIREHSNPDDKLFVWGDQPSIYLYAGREIFNQDHLILYAHNRELALADRLVADLWENPPEHILFYNYKVNDGWQMDRLQEAIGVKYQHVQSFRVSDASRAGANNPEGVFFEAPLYRRDDTQYRRVLLERIITAAWRKDADLAARRLDALLRVFPDDREALVLGKLLDLGPDANGTAREMLERELAAAGDDICRSMIRKRLGEVAATHGQFQEAGHHFSEALKANPDDPCCWNALGQILLRSNYRQDAARCFQKALEIDGYSAETLNNVSIILAEQGRLPEAVTALKKAGAYLPDHPPIAENIRRLTDHQAAVGAHP